MSGREGGDAHALGAALSTLGLRCAVESRAGLAVIAADASHVAALGRLESRREVLALARQHGFTHVAVELTAEPAGVRAPLLRD